MPAPPGARGARDGHRHPRGGCRGVGGADARARGRAARPGRAPSGRVRGGRAGRGEPRYRGRPSGARRRPRARRADPRGARARLPDDDRGVRRDHGHQRQDDDHRPDRRAARGVRATRPGGRQHRSAARRRGADLSGPRVGRRGGVELPAGDGGHLPAPRGGGAERDAGSPRPARDRRRLCGGEGPDLPGAGSSRLGSAERRRPRRGGPGGETSRRRSSGSAGKARCRRGRGCGTDG